MEIPGLTEAIERFHDAATGSFRAPSEGEWDAPMLLAHIAETARTFSDTTRLLLEGRAEGYDNASSTFEPTLRGIVERTGDLDALRVLARARWDELVSLTSRLTPGQGATMVHVRVIDGDVVLLNRARPWADALATQSKIHLPAHTDALLALRA